MSWRKIVWTLLGAPVMSLCAAGHVSLTAPMMAPPVLDGSLDDAAWRDAARIERLYLYGSDQATADTVIYMGYDQRWLYLGFDCANSNLSRVSQKVFKHDGAVHTDDSMEIFIRPDAARQRYYQFKLSYANVTAEQRTSDAGARDDGWLPPWRSFVKRRPDGWTAEVAIPWFVLESEDLSGCQINLCRNLMRIELDDYGAKKSETWELHTLQPNVSGSAHNFKVFAAVSGLAGLRPELPFVPQVTSAELTGLIQKNESFYYGVKASLETASPVAGRVLIRVVEDSADGEEEKFSETVALDGRRELNLEAPAGDLGMRRIRLELADPEDGSLFASWEIEDISALNVIQQAYATRSYFTSEAQAGIALELGLPREMLQDAELTAEVNGSNVLTIAKLQSRMRPAIPMEMLSHGDNPVVLRALYRGREMATQTVNLIRREPRPGHEVKADLVRGVLLKDDAPFFPVGMCAHALGMSVKYRHVRDGEEGMFRFLRDVGFNTLIRSTYEDGDMFMKLAGQYGLNVVTWTMPEPLFLAGTNVFKRWGEWKSFQQANKVDDLPLPARLDIQRKWYNELEPTLIQDAEILSKYTNMLGYYNVDEPNLINPDERIAAAGWYWQTIQAVDPYRPVMLLYSMDIPRGDIWTRCGEMLGLDIYPRPFTPGIFGEPGLYTAYYAHALRERCRQDHKVMFFIPLSNILDPGRSPIGLGRDHMLCQAYVAAIYGAKGLFYFALSNVVGEHAWDALRAICAQFKEMAPALLNGETAVEIQYTPDNFRPREQKFPMVNAALYQYPDGDHLLLAANIMPYAVETTFQVGGIKHVARMFTCEGQRGKEAEGLSEMELDGESFKEKIEPYGVRAYRMQLSGAASDAAQPVAIAVVMSELEDEKARQVDVPGIIRRVMLGKNYMPNPCFQQQFHKGIPDFYRPYFNVSIDPDAGKKGSTWYVDDEALWEGKPSLRMFRRPIVAPDYRGPGNKTRGTFGVFHPPQSDKPRKLTFSFYARSAETNHSLWLRICGREITYKNMATNWARYHLTLDWRGDNLFLMIPSENSTVWINGLQIEEGEEPTPFQDDSVAVPTTAAVESGGLLKNGGAECGSAEGWTGLASSSGEIGLRRGIGRTGEYGFIWRGQSSTIYSDWIAVDTNTAYELSGWFRAESEAPVSILFGLTLADQDRRKMGTHNFMSVPGSRTVLAADCGVGDRTLQVHSAAGWETGRWFVAAFGKEPNELNFDVTPPGIIDISQGDDVWKVVLREPCGLAAPAGTPVVENRTSNGGIFVAVYVPVSNDWQELKGVIAPSQWWPGTRYVKVWMQPRRSGKTDTLYIDDLAFKPQGE